MTVSKPSVVVPSVDGSCTLPKTPTKNATTAPAANAASGMAVLFRAVASAIGSGCSGRRRMGRVWLGHHVVTPQLAAPRVPCAARPCQGEPMADDATRAVELARLSKGRYRATNKSGDTLEFG